MLDGECPNPTRQNFCAKQPGDRVQYGLPGAAGSLLPRQIIHLRDASWLATEPRTACI